MNCEAYLQLVDELIDHTLEQNIAAEALAHSIICSRCEDEFDTLKIEKAIFTQYLFNIEPPSALTASFKAKLANVKKPKFAQTKIGRSLVDWLVADSIPMFRIPAGVGLGLLLFVCGIVWLNLDQDKHLSIAVTQNEIPLPGKSENVELTRPVPIPDLNLASLGATPSKPTPRGHVDIGPTISQIPSHATFSKRMDAAPNVVEARVSRTYLSQVEKSQITQVWALEIETAKQMEKVELLLRSFRNIRYAEGREEFEVMYEKQQAQKLLDRNFELRRNAKSYGTQWYGEMLSKVEPFLLEIANLDKNPSASDVFRIKERVRDQKIILALQRF